LIPARIEFIHTLGSLWQNPHKTPDSIAVFQNRKLRSVIAYAYENVPYYRSLFNRCGIKPEDIRTAKDLSAIPITSSQDYRIRPLKETLSRLVKPERTLCRATSGSSGRPFLIRRTFLEDHLLNFFRIRTLQQFGVQIRDKIAHIRLVSASHQRQNLLGGVRQSLGIYRDFPVNSLQSAARIWKELAELRPDVIKGYPAVLTHISSYREKQDASNLDLRFIVAGGEALPAYRRKQIEQGFGRKVYDLYGSHEFNLLAWECRQNGQYHICDDNVIFEILHNGRPARVGEHGEVVVTGLHSYSMPFIRYRLGDIATRGPEICSCGQPFSTLLDVQGRMHDYFKLPDGQLMHPDRLVVPIMENESSWFDRYQLLQEREDLIILNIQPFRPPQKAQVAHVEQLARNILPGGVEFRVNLVESLSAEAGGKFRFCKSLVHSEVDAVNREFM
jgi:phenylacetate-CoA ligase